MHLSTGFVFLSLLIIKSITTHPSIHRHLHKHRINGGHQYHDDVPPSLQVQQPIPHTRFRQPPERQERLDIFASLSFSSAIEYPEEAVVVSNVAVPLHRRIRTGDPSGLPHRLHTVRLTGAYLTGQPGHSQTPYKDLEHIVCHAYPVLPTDGARSNTRDPNFAHPIVFTYRDGEVKLNDPHGWWSLNSWETASVFCV